MKNYKQKSKYFFGIFILLNMLYAYGTVEMYGACFPKPSPYANYNGLFFSYSNFSDRKENMIPEFWWHLKGDKGNYEFNSTYGKGNISSVGLRESTKWGTIYDDEIDTTNKVAFDYENNENSFKKKFYINLKGRDQNNNKWSFNFENKTGTVFGKAIVSFNSQDLDFFCNFSAHAFNDFKFSSQDTGGYPVKFKNDSPLPVYNPMVFPKQAAECQGGDVKINWIYENNQINGTLHEGDFKTNFETKNIRVYSTGRDVVGKDEEYKKYYITNGFLNGLIISMKAKLTDGRGFILEEGYSDAQFQEFQDLLVPREIIVSKDGLSGTNISERNGTFASVYDSVPSIVSNINLKFNYVSPKNEDKRLTCHYRIYKPWVGVREGLDNINYQKNEAPSSTYFGGLKPSDGSQHQGREMDTHKTNQGNQVDRDEEQKK